MNKLSAKEVEKAPAKDKEYNLSDGGGLFLRVRASGAKSWVYFFRLPDDRQLHRMTLGSLTDMSLKEARNELTDLRKLVKKGIDPRAERAAAKTENAQAITLQTLFDMWIAFERATKKMSTHWIKRHEDRWRVHLKKPLGALLARDITRFHLAAVLEKMAIKGIREETRKALTSLNLMLDYGLTHRHINENPARLLKPKDFNVSASKPRDRVLSLDELNTLWKVLEEATTLQENIASTATMTIITTSAIKLLIVLGARRGEVAGMRWAELKLNEKIWLLPKERTKNKQSHIIYLPDIAIKIINSLQPLTGHSKYVFDTGRDSKNGYIHVDTLTSALARLRGFVKGKVKAHHTLDLHLADLEPFTIHDLRRSAATAWGEHLKINPHVIEKMLNHQPLNKLVATYQCAIYADEQKAAWSAWGEMIEQRVIVGINNVIPLRQTVNG